ncbi:YkgJ family cysteine cluster protein [Archangium gephyra]|uniref:YkgJ family cysteine cluster protein n=1 Tax=Archangium gephyra TaxID=48 RepID=UPI0035D3E0C3
MTAPGIPESPLSVLCRGCGLCCDGSLFSHVGLEPEELERLRALGIPIKQLRSGTQVLAQRCAALEGRDCKIYKDRPSSCAAYQCLLAESLVEQRVTLEEAQAVVRKAQRLIAIGHARRFLRQRFRGRKGLD